MIEEDKELIINIDQFYKSVEKKIIETTSTQFKDMCEILRLSIMEVKLLGLFSTRMSSDFKEEDLLTTNYLKQKKEESDRVLEEFDSYVKFMGKDKLEWMRIKDNSEPVDKGVRFFKYNYYKINMYGNFIVSEETENNMKLTIEDKLALSAYKIGYVKCANVGLDSFLSTLIIGPVASIIRCISRKTLDRLWIQMEQKAMAFYELVQKVEKCESNYDDSLEVESESLQSELRDNNDVKNVRMDALTYDEIMSYNQMIVVDPIDQIHINCTQVKATIVFDKVVAYYWYEHLMQFLSRREMIKYARVCKWFYVQMRNKELNFKHNYNINKLTIRVPMVETYDSVGLRLSVIKFIHESFIYGCGENTIIDYLTTDLFKVGVDIYYLFYKFVKYLAYNKGTSRYYYYLDFYCRYLSGVWRFPFSKFLRNPLSNIFEKGGYVSTYIMDTPQTYDISVLKKYEILQKYGMQKMILVSFKSVAPVSVVINYGEGAIYSTTKEMINHIETMAIELRRRGNDRFVKEQERRRKLEVSRKELIERVKKKKQNRKDDN